jgi:pantothenate synthetase
MSSRNAYLTHPERTAAPLIYKGLSAAAARYDNGERNAAELVETVKKIIAANSLLTPEYVEIVDMVSLRPLAELSNPALMAVACRTGGSKTRLIDNIILGGSW